MVKCKICIDKPTDPFNLMDPFVHVICLILGPQDITLRIQVKI